MGVRYTIPTIVTSNIVDTSSSSVLSLSSLPSLPSLWKVIQGGERSSTRLRSLEEENDNNDDKNNYNDDSNTYQSCQDILSIPPSAERCSYASTCNGGKGLLLSFVFCSDPDNDNNKTYHSPYFYTLLLSPPLILWLVLLFRMLGTTAEFYFSPSLEMFSLNLGLPPRFAGVTLLALGNGAADVSATVNAMKLDPENGYLMGLGALTGAGMFVSTIVAGVVIVIGDGLHCRGALVRDVTMFALTIGVVLYSFDKGYVDNSDIRRYLVMYGIFVLVVLIADVYHRKVVLKRQSLSSHLEEGIMEAEGAEGNGEKEVQKQQQLNTVGTFTESPTSPSTVRASTIRGKSRVAIDAVLGALSNYDRIPTGDEDKDDLYGYHHTRNGGGSFEAEPYHAMVNGDESGLNPPSIATGASYNWTGAWHDGCREIRIHAVETWQDTISLNDNDKEGGGNSDGLIGDDDTNEGSLLEKVSRFLRLCEIPFTILRKVTVPIPCEGYYCRALCGLSLALAPLWLGVYAIKMFNTNLFLFGSFSSDDNEVSSSGFQCIEPIFVLTVVLGALFVRFAPSADGPSVDPKVSVPLAMFGFFVAATWIDAISDQLVRLLTFFGVIFHIPNSIMGLTILAWGNSMGDLSANMTMAKKGLANMAITACFAGPVFNILVGLGIGFMSLNADGGKTKVELDASITVGFFFLLCNCVLVLFFGFILNRGIIPREYGYAALVLYAAYILTSLALQFRN